MPRRARARRADRPELVLQVRDLGPRRLRPPAAAGRRRPRQAAGRAGLYPALQRARRHRGRSHLRAARREPLLHGDRQRLRRARHGLDQQAPAGRRLGHGAGADVGPRHNQPRRAAFARHPAAARRRRRRQRGLSLHDGARAAHRASRRCWRCASLTWASWATSCTCRAEYAAHVYELLWAAGRDLGLADAGYRAIDSLRLEKRYLYWGSDITPDYTPYEAGLGFAVSLKKKSDFIGRAALEKAKAAGPRRAS